MSNVEALAGDCVEVMGGMASDSIDAIVTDPPYELGFMGKRWDSSGIAYSVGMWAEALRVLKPGGHLLAFGGTRTYHRMTVAIEDAGFEIRDCIQWLYGSGFPKSHDISKAIDKAAGSAREVVGVSKSGPLGGRKDGSVAGTGQFRDDSWTSAGQNYITAPATPEAEQWSGWGTALKPANEPIVLARKPLSEQTVAANVLEHGTGALNIDGCRIGSGGHDSGSVPATQNIQGRWPANVILDETAAELLDVQSGIRSKGAWPKGEVKCEGVGNVPMKTNSYNPERIETEAGGASRFFYVAKASKRERGQGNNHPTVKPVTLIRYLIRLITPPNGTVLDPFAGSGTTGLAALAEGVDCILIEREPEYVRIICRRLAL